MIRKGLEVGLAVQDVREPGPLDGEAAVVGWLGLVPYSWGLKEGGEAGGSGAQTSVDPMPCAAAVESRVEGLSSLLPV